MTGQHIHEDSEFITIIGADMGEINRSFQAQGLAARQFAIVHRTGRHCFTMAGAEESGPMFNGRPLIAATYARRIPS